MIVLEPRPGHSETISTMALTRVDSLACFSFTVPSRRQLRICSLLLPVFCLQPGQGLIKGGKKCVFPTSFLYDYKRNRGEEPVRKIAKRNLGVSERE